MKSQTLAMMHLALSRLGVDDHRLTLLLPSLSPLFLILLVQAASPWDVNCILPPVLTLSSSPLFAPSWRNLHHLIPVSPVGQRPPVRHMVCPMVGKNGPRGRALNLRVLVHYLQ
jgi:hypothetical protein